MTLVPVTPRFAMAPMNSAMCGVTKWASRASWSAHSSYTRNSPQLGGVHPEPIADVALLGQGRLDEWTYCREGSVVVCGIEGDGA